MKEGFSKEAFLFLYIISDEHLDDQKLIQACINNNRKAQFQLYQHYYAFVSGICIRYLKEEGLARETVNDIFLKLFTKISMFDAAKASFNTWLKTIAVNTCLDKMKLQSFENKTIPLNEDEELEVFAVDQSFSTENILQLVHALPNRQRAIFNLFIVEGYTHDEIGKMLCISAGNSRWYLNDAKQRIKKALTQTGYKV